MDDSLKNMFLVRRLNGYLILLMLLEHATGMILFRSRELHPFLFVLEALRCIAE